MGGDVRNDYPTKIILVLLLLVISSSLYTPPVSAYIVKPTGQMFGPNVRYYNILADKIFVYSRQDSGVKMTCLDIKTFTSLWSVQWSKVIKGKDRHWFDETLFVNKNNLYYIYDEYVFYDNDQPYDYEVHQHLKCVDINTGKELSSFDNFEYEFIEDYRNNDYFHKNNFYLVSLNDNINNDNKDSLILYNINTNEVVWTSIFSSITTFYCCVLDGDRIIINAHLRDTICLDFNTGKQIWSQKSYVLSQQLYSNGNTLFEYSDDCGLSQLTSIDIQTGKILWQIKNIYGGDYDLYLVGEKEGLLVISCKYISNTKWEEQSRYIITLDSKNGKELSRYKISERYLYWMYLDYDDKVVYFEKKGFYYLKKNVFDYKKNCLARSVVYNFDSKYDYVEVAGETVFGIKDSFLYKLKVQ